MKRITEQHKKDYAELIELVKSHNLVELKECIEITNDDDEYLDFYYKSFLATIIKANPPYLSGICSLNNGENTWTDNIRMSESIDLLGISWGELSELDEQFEEQVKQKKICFESEDDKVGCREDFIDQYQRYGIANLLINVR